MPSIGVRSALLVSFLVASGLPLLVFLFWPHSAALQSQVDEVEERHLVLAGSVADTLERYGDDVSATFASLAPLMDDGRELAFASALLETQGFVHFCLIDPATGEVLRAFAVGGARPPEVLPESMLQAATAMAARAPGQLSPVVVSTPDPRLLLAKRFGDRIVLAAVDTGYIQQLARRISFGYQGHIAIFDATGHVIAHPNAAWVREARDLSALEPVRRMIQGERGVSEFHSPAIDADVIAGFTTVDGLGWGIMVPQPMAELTAKADTIARSVLLVFLAGLSLSILMSLFISNLCARGIRRVSRAAQRMARGEEGVRIGRQLSPVALYEIEELRWSFNSLACQIEDSRRRLIALAERDGLTGLLNRGAFLRGARDAVEMDLADADGHILFYIDVDDFKSINDVYGHSTGDALLRHIASLLRDLAGPDALVARQSGDEFLVFQPRGTTEQVQRFGRELLARISEPLTIRQQRISFSCSIGACVVGEDGGDLESAINCADQAMYSAKNHGPGQLNFYDQALHRWCKRKELQLIELKASLRNSVIQPAFQPIFDLETGRLAGFEALARWSGDVAREIRTDQFIALGEESGLIHEIGQQVRRRAFAFAAELAAEGVDVPLAINVSRMELARSGFVSGLEADVAAHSLSPSDIVLEITESIFDDRGGALRDTLCTLRQSGFHLALDDFGKGYSSHGLLLAYPFDRIKIDMNFIGDVCDDEKANAVVSSLVDLGKSLQLRIVMEGIETPAGVAFAQSTGVTEVQGFFYSRPLSRADAHALALDLAAHYRPRGDLRKLATFAGAVARSA